MSKPSSKQSAKQLGIWSLIALVAGNMIGSGIFLLPANLASIGTISLVSWCFTSAGAILLALMFGRLSRKLPLTGGPYAYARTALGEFLGFQTGFNYWLALWVGNAAIVIAAVGYLSVFFPHLAHPRTAAFTGIAIIWAITIINCFGVATAGLVQLTTTILKLIPIVFICLLGWHFIHPHNFTHYYNVSKPHVSNFSAMSTAATLTFWAFIGLESATVPADSVKNPSKTIPLATIIGVLVAATVYIISSIVIMGIIPAPILAHSVSPFADAADIILGPWGKNFIAIGAIVSALGCLNGWVLLQGQIGMAAAEDGLFPKFFAKRNKNDVPQNGLIVTSVLISILLLLTISPDLVKQFQLIILLAVLATLIPYLYTVIAEITLMSTEPDRFNAKWCFRLLLSVLAGVYVVWAIIGSGHQMLYYGCLLLLTTVPLYAWVRKQK